MKKYLVLAGLFQGGRNIFGAISVPYLLSKGLSLSDLALLKSAQTIAVFLLEFPTGFIADHCGRWMSIVVSLFVGFITFVCYYFADSLPAFLIAEVLLALSLSLWSGAFEAYAIDSLAIGESQSQLHRFYHSERVYVSAAIIFSVLLGGLISEQSLSATYAVSAFIFLSTLVWTLFSFSKDTKATVHQIPKLVLFIRSAAAAIRMFRNWNVVVIGVGLIMAEVVLMPLIYFWQPYFSRFTQQMPGLGLGAVFIFFQVAIMFSGFLFAKLSTKSYIHTQWFWLGLWSVFCSVMIGISYSSTYAISLALFCILEFCYVTGEGAMKAALNHMVPSNERATFLSFMSLIRKTGGVVALLLIGQMLGTGRSSASSPLELEGVFQLFGKIGLVFYTLLTVWVVVKNVKAKAVSKRLCKSACIFIAD